MKTLEYYYVKKGVIEHVIFNKYTIDENGVIKNKKTGKAFAYTKTNLGYKKCMAIDGEGNRRNISGCRAIVSTFCGPPPTPEHTADHKDQNPSNDTIDNIQWLCKSGQRTNQTRPKISNTARIIIKDGEEKTAREWGEHFKNQKNHMGRGYTMKMIICYADENQHGFSYKVYQNLPMEIWKEIPGSNNSKGRWEISNMCRVKNISKKSEKMISNGQFSLNSGYPAVKINGKQWKCHILAFMAFFPDKWANKKSDEIVLHDNDDKMDFRPYKLSLGTQSENGKQAHKNGCYDGTKTAMMKCASYINYIFEKEHESLADSARYLRSLGYDKASPGPISQALQLYRDGETRMRYGRTWKDI